MGRSLDMPPDAVLCGLLMLTSFSISHCTVSVRDKRTRGVVDDHWNAKWKWKISFPHLSLESYPFCASKGGECQQSWPMDN